MASQRVGATRLDHLEADGEHKGTLTAVVETTQGRRSKYKYDPKRGVFVLGSVLPAGAVFPYDFGFFPRTTGGDGDPLDVLILMDEPAFPGCVLDVRLVGVIEAEQTERDGETTRNDRLIAVAETAHEHTGVRQLTDLPKRLLNEIEHFFVSYNQTKGKQFKVLGRHGPARARKLVEQAQRAFEED